MLPSLQLTQNRPAVKRPRNVPRLPRIRRGKRVEYTFVQTNSPTYRSNRLQELTLNKFLSDTRPRRGIRSFRPVGDNWPESSELPTTLACLEYPGPVKFVHVVFLNLNQSTGPLDESVPNSPPPPPA